MHVTLNQLKKWVDCTEGYKKVLNHVGLDYDKDKPINLSVILTSNDIDDTFWCVGNMTLTPDQERDFRFLACGYAERVLPIFEKKYPEDSRPKDCIEVAKRYAVGEATKEDLDAARAAAWDARAAAWAAGDAAWAARDARAAGAARAAWAAEKTEQEKMLMELLLSRNQY